MENKLMIFENEAFGKVRTLNLNGEPWFVAVDVCSVLDLSNPTIAVSRLDEDERAKFNLGRQGDATIVNEPGLYTLVLGSRKQYDFCIHKLGCGSVLDFLHVPYALNGGETP